jgi:hypothetical protein
VSHLSETELAVDVGPRAPINIREARVLLMALRFYLLKVRQGETWTPPLALRLTHTHSSLASHPHGKCEPKPSCLTRQRIMRTHIAAACCHD